MATPAEPAPFTTTLQSSFFLPVTRRPLMIPARTTIAVPCWSSWNTGISSIAFKRSSISKQRGAEMSSRLIPPNAGAIFLMVAMISSVSCVSKTDRNSIHIAEFFEKNTFSFHNRHSGIWPDIAKS